MKYYIFVEKDGSVNGCGQCEQLTEGVKNIEVSVDVYNSFSEDSLRYVYSNGKIIPNPNYEND